MILNWQITILERVDTVKKKSNTKDRVNYFNNIYAYYLDLSKKILSVIYFIIIKLIKNNAKLYGAKRLAKDFKSSENMFILATGDSINNYCKKDFETIKKSDSIGINFFILHNFIPKLYLIEPHENECGYFSELDQKKFKEASIMYKGYASPRKLFKVILNIIKVPSSIKNFLVMKDAYQNENFNFIPPLLREKMLNVESSDYFYNRIASIIYVVYMSYKMGYKSVVLCGFDMSDKYFYCENNKNLKQANKYNLCNPENSHRLNKTDRKKEIIEILVFMNNRFKTERGGGVFMYSRDGILSEYLPLYNQY
jgi:hypothetical protein